jgi:asparagine synthase (glutamine-hydrolysing)
MFAFAIWDRHKSELFVARDRLGVKPLYYSMTSDGVLVFASEIRAILESGLVVRKLDRGALSEYLMYQSVYAPRTIVENIRQLPAAVLLRLPRFKTDDPALLAHRGPQAGV